MDLLNRLKPEVRFGFLLEQKLLDSGDILNGPASFQLDDTNYYIFSRAVTGKGPNMNLIATVAESRGRVDVGCYEESLAVKIHEYIGEIQELYPEFEFRLH